MKNLTFVKQLVCLLAVPVLFFTTNALADVTIKNNGMYIIDKICTGDFSDERNCQEVSLLHDQSYTIPSSHIPPEGTQIFIKALCVAPLMFPIIEAQGLTYRFVQDGEEVAIGGVCNYSDNNNHNTLPYSHGVIFHWNLV